MPRQHIIFVPGKNPKPPPLQHLNMLWRTLLEGVRRAEPEQLASLSQRKEIFKLAAWNYLYYQRQKDIHRDIPWIDALMNQHGPTNDDIREALAHHRKLHLMFYHFVDLFPFVLRFLSGALKSTSEETRQYFQNEHNIGCNVREVLKKELRPILGNNEKVLLIGHSMGSIIAYDTLWELSHLEHHPGKVDILLTLGSPLGMRYVRKRLVGNNYSGKKKYPTNIQRWINISSTGDLTSLNHSFAHDFAEMKQLGLVESIEDHCHGIYNFFHNEKGLNCHRSYGYMVNPAVGKVIADWWQDTNEN